MTKRTREIARHYYDPGELDLTPTNSPSANQFHHTAINVETAAEPGAEKNLCANKSFSTASTPRLTRPGERSSTGSRATASSPYGLRNISFKRRLLVLFSRK
jgi:hypothetical protein